MSGYASGGYTHEFLAAVDTASQTVNQRKERIARLLAMASGIIRNSDRGADVLLGDVLLDYDVAIPMFVRVRKDPRTGKLELAIGRREDAQFDAIYELQYVSGQYPVEDVPLKFVKPLSIAMPQIFGLIAERYPYFSVFLEGLIQLAKELEGETGAIRPVMVKPGNQIIMTVLDHTGIGLSLVQLRTPHETGYTVKAEQKMFGMSSIQPLAEFLGRLSGLRVELVGSNETAHSAFFR